MKLMKRVFALLLVLGMLMSWGCLEVAATGDAGVDAILGTYHGSFSGNDGSAGLTLWVFSTRRLMENESWLQTLADAAQSCGGSVTAQMIKNIARSHGEPYIAFFHYYPKDGKGGKGLYTMKVKCQADTYEFTAFQWICEDSWTQVELKNVRFDGVTLSGDVYDDYSQLFWSQYGDVGNVSVRCEGVTGHRVKFPQDSVSLSVYGKLTLHPQVVDGAGTIVSNPGKITWFSSDETVVQVSGTEALTLSGVGAGEAAVYGETESGRLSACRVKVSASDQAAPLTLEVTREPVSQITLDETEYYRYAPNYILTALVRNTRSVAMTDVQVRLTLPEGMALYEDAPLTRSIASLAPNASQEFTWSVVVPAQRDQGAVATCTVSAESATSAPVVSEQTISVPPYYGADHRLDTQKDVWFFTNRQTEFPQGHFMTEKSLAAMMAGLTPVERQRVSSYRAATWSGSGYGMAAVVSLMKTGHLDAGDYRQGAAKPSHLPAPRDDEKIYSLITGYQLSQKLTPVLTAKETQLWQSQSQRLKGLVMAVDKMEFGGTPVVLSIWYLDGAGQVCNHSLLPYQLERGAFTRTSRLTGRTDQYDKRLVIYDPNHQGPLYLYVNGDFTQWDLDGYCQNPVGEDGQPRSPGEGCFVYTDSPETLNAQPDAHAPVRARLTVQGDAQLRVEDVTYTLAGGILTDNPDGKLLCYADGLTPGYTCLTQADVRQMTVSGTMDFVYEYPGIALAVRADQARQAELDADGEIYLAAPQGAYTLTLVDDRAVWHTLTLTGSGTSDIRLTAGGDGTWQLTGENLNGLSLTAQSEEVTLTQTVTTQATGVEVAATPLGLIVTDHREEVPPPTQAPQAPEEPQPPAEKAQSPWLLIILVVMLVILLSATGVTVYLLVTKKKIPWPWKKKQ